MLDYIKRLLIAGIMALCVSLLFFGGKHSQASEFNPNSENISWIWPSNGVISDTFGTRNGKHKGIDIAGELNSPILAVDNGVVERSYYSDSYGHVIFIKHPNNLVTVYAHLNERLVTEGQAVKQGDIIGKMGMTGQATGIHLHFETHKSEWTYEKKYVFDPAGLLGDMKQGEVVQAGAPNNEKNVLEASTRVRPYEVENVGNQQNNYYIVKKGDTLWSIAQNNNVQISQIQTLNKLESTNVLIGEKLIINKLPNDQYIVKEGDTLTSISEKSNLSVEKLKAINKLSNDLIKTDQVLLLPQSNN